MGETIKIAGADGFEFSAYHEPSFTPRKGGVIVIQEIFGIDRHVRADVEAWAKAKPLAVKRQVRTEVDREAEPIPIEGDALFNVGDDIANCSHWNAPRMRTQCAVPQGVPT